MLDVLLSHIQNKVAVTDEDKERIPSFFTSRKLRKNNICFRKAIFVNACLL
jgi:hypothetical protein